MNNINKIFTVPEKITLKNILLTFGYAIYFCHGILIHTIGINHIDLTIG